MKIYRNFNIDKKFKKSVIAIGNFDGLHLGHVKVLNQAQKKARQSNLKFGVVTFEPVPVLYFNKKIKNHRINDLDQKIDGLQKLKINFLSIIKFNKKFSNLSPDDFIKKIIFKNLNCRFIFISKNFRFGKNREGDVKKLKSNEKNYFYKTIITKTLKKDSKVLSSSYIRKLLAKGELQKANKFLGRSWSIEGKVVKGDMRGRKIGFPTCNIKLENYILPKLGVYAVQLKVNKIFKKGIANIGYRPTFKGKMPLLEVNIFGLKANLYKKTLKVNFIKFIRKEKKFKNVRALKLQIKKDIIKAKN